MPGQVGAEGHDAGGLIHDAGDADADGGNLGKIVVALRNHAQGELGHVVNHGLVAALHQGGAAELVENAALFIDETGLDAGAAEVDTDVQHGIASI